MIDMFGTAMGISLVSTFDVSGRGKPVGHAVRYDRTGTLAYCRAIDALVRLPITALCAPILPPLIITLSANAAKLQLSACPGPSGPAVGPSRVSSVRNGAARGTTRP